MNVFTDLVSVQVRQNSFPAATLVMRLEIQLQLASHHNYHQVMNHLGQLVQGPTNLYFKIKCKQRKLYFGSLSILRMLGTVNL